MALSAFTHIGSHFGRSTLSKQVARIQPEKQ